MATTVSTSSAPSFWLVPPPPAGSAGTLLTTRGARLSEQEVTPQIAAYEILRWADRLRGEAEKAKGALLAVAPLRSAAVQVGTDRASQLWMQQLVNEVNAARAVLAVADLYDAAGLSIEQVPLDLMYRWDADYVRTPNGLRPIAGSGWHRTADWRTYARAQIAAARADASALPAAARSVVNQAIEGAPPAPERAGMGLAWFVAVPIIILAVGATGAVVYQLTAPTSVFSHWAFGASAVQAQTTAAIREYTAQRMRQCEGLAGSERDACQQRALLLLDQRMMQIASQGPQGAATRAQRAVSTALVGAAAVGLAYFWFKGLPTLQSSRAVHAEAR